MFQTKVVEKIKRAFHSQYFFFKSRRLSDNVDKYSTVGESTEDNMALAHSRWVPRATNTLSGYAVLIALPLKQWFARTRLNVTLCTLAVLFLSKFICLLSTINSSSFDSILWINLPYKEAFSMLMVIKSRYRRGLTDEH